MQNSFENNIAEQLSQFQLQPSEQVWKEVAAALDKKPSRKFPAFWWVGICGILIAGGYWMSKKVAKDTVQKYPPTVQATAQSPVQLPVQSLAQSPVQPTIQLSVQPIHEKNISTANQTTNLSFSPSKIIPNRYQKSNKLFSNNDSSNPIQTSITQQSNPSLLIDSTKEHPSNESFVEQKTANQIIIPTELVSTVNTKISPNKKGHLIFFVGGGTTHQNNNGITQSFSAADRLSFAAGSNVGAIGSGATVPTELSSAINGFHVLIGMGYEKPIGKRVSLGMALQYSYHQNSQPFGKQIDSIQIINSALTQNNSIVKADHYYTGGSIETLTNQAHWLSLPFTFYYNINHSRKNKIQLLFGTSPTWIITQKWLIKDELSKQFYYAPALNNAFNLSIDIGMRYLIQNNWGLTAKYNEGIIATTKLTNNKTYWNTFSLQINKTILFSNKKDAK